MNKGIFALGILLILAMVSLKYIVVPTIVNSVSSQLNQYLGSQVSSQITTAENLGSLCNAIKSNTGIFGISTQDITKAATPDIVSKCDQFLSILTIVSYEYVFYLVGIILIVLGLALDGKREVIREFIRVPAKRRPRRRTTRGGTTTTTTTTTTTRPKRKR